MNSKASSASRAAAKAISGFGEPAVSTIGFSDVGPPNWSGSLRKTLTRAIPRLGRSMFSGAPVISRPLSLRPLSEPAFWIWLSLNFQRSAPFWITICWSLKGKLATALPEMTS